MGSKRNQFFFTESTKAVENYSEGETAGEFLDFKTGEG